MDTSYNSRATSGEARPLRRHIEMASVSEEGWRALEGFADEIEVQLLADDLDESRKRGARSRLVRFAPGASTRHVLVHDYWEEVFVLSGDLLARDGESDSHSEAPEPGRNQYRYSCRPPGTPHGPFHSERGCVLFEVQYFLPDHR
ncbi:cupin domain-containing protein [Paraburkholderia bengalensis]|uniref:cupin domain-containing protein n=1 Tax=Paraburkholderia bengalensis TaxID=2747562 RepID=UPI003AF81247